MTVNFWKKVYESHKRRPELLLLTDWGNKKSPPEPPYLSTLFQWGEITVKSGSSACLSPVLLQALVLEFLAGQFCRQQCEKSDKTWKVLLQGICLTTSLVWVMSAALNHSWQRAAEIFCSLLFSAGSCPFSMCVLWCHPCGFFQVARFWILDSKFKPRHYQEVGNVN